ncbi:MAG: hypothetical protein ACREWE_03955 [Gammaproteobacteria bacterium]
MPLPDTLEAMNLNQLDDPLQTGSLVGHQCRLGAGLRRRDPKGVVYGGGQPRAIVSVEVINLLRG